MDDIHEVQRDWRRMVVILEIAFVSLHCHELHRVVVSLSKFLSKGYQGYILTLEKDVHTTLEGLGSPKALGNHIIFCDTGDCLFPVLKVPKRSIVRYIDLV